MHIYWKIWNRISRGVFKLIYFEQKNFTFIGVDWKKEKNFIQKNGNPLYGSDYFDGLQNTFQIHVRNDVDQSIKFRETAPAIGPVVVVPKDVTAKVDYIDKDRTGKLTFEAVGEDSNGVENKFLLNGRPEFVVDEQFLSPEGEFVVVHRTGHSWEEILQEMKLKMIRSKGISNSIQNVGFSSVDNRFGVTSNEKSAIASNDSTLANKVENDTISAENDSMIIGQQFDKLNNTGSRYGLDEDNLLNKTTPADSSLVSYNFTAAEINKNNTGALSGNTNESVKTNSTEDSHLSILSGNISMIVDADNTTTNAANNSKANQTSSVKANETLAPINVTSSTLNTTNITLENDGKVLASFGLPSIIEKSDAVVKLENGPDTRNVTSDTKVNHFTEKISTDKTPDHSITSGLVGTVGGTDGVSLIDNRNAISSNDSVKLLNTSASPGKVKESENLIMPLHGEVNHYYIAKNSSSLINGTNGTSPSNETGSIKGQNSIVLGAPYNNVTILSGKANMVQSLEFGNTFIISLANLADEDATLLEGNSQTIYIPSKAAVSATLRGNGSFLFSAETKEGHALKIDGEDKKLVKEYDMPATLIIHEDGNKIFSIHLLF